ncbi:hypothetical protein FC26_GL002009 [Paucilactobacillus vaccinostercus DSM 20634]|uniref:DnaD domain-containing protein n=1 Tax=Paucilactobacillus vaccinostercus DSM 20634 TaxID=1423813 RepID=A0A0R2A9X8_9LACO|nr:hypothetical protein [Paucilactobacillus vaccinostercus]KRM62436.1 hypothetical protein FC26_GL002009 [Paucilactobacillus vaccinostercus DSM 20634]
MTIHRAPHDRGHPYTVIDNTILDSDLSNNAKVVMWTLLSNRDDWKPHSQQLMARLNMSRKPFDKAIKELKEYGLLSITKTNGNKGHYDYDWDIKEVSSSLAQTSTNSSKNEESTEVEPQRSISDTANGNATIYTISSLFRIDFDYFISESPLCDMSDQDRTALFNLAGRLNHEIKIHGYQYSGSTEKETSRMMKVAFIKSIHKQPNPIGYIISTVDGWIKSDLLSMDDLERDQLERSDSELYDVLKMHDIGEDYIGILDDNGVDWDMM